MFATKMYVVQTTFLGADSYSEFYFLDLDAAEEFLATCLNGNIEETWVFNADPNKLWNGMTSGEVAYATGRVW
jgi:hypothetical protein